MQLVVIETRAVGFLLRPQHDVFQIVAEQEAVFALFHDLGFEQIAGVDITDDLRNVLQRAFDQHHLFLVAGGVADRGVQDDRFVKG